MQNQNGEENIINKELLPLIEYAKWELYNFNLLKKSSKVIKSEFILIEKDTIKKWKEKSGYNIFKKQIFSHILALNKIKNMKDKIKQENESINNKWQKAIQDKIVNLNNLTSLPVTDLSGLYLSLKENKINAYKNYEIISSKLYNIFKKFINYKIIVEGFYHNGKLIIPMNYKNQITNLRTSLKSGENFLEIIYLNNKNELEDMLCLLPNDNSICKEIEDYYINETLDNLISNIFSHMDKKDNKFITDFIDSNGNKVQYKILNKKDNSKKQANVHKNGTNTKNNESELEKLKLILGEKIKILKEVNERINQKNNNLMKLKLNIEDKNNNNNNFDKKKLDDMKNKYFKFEKEYENKQKELENKKQCLKNKEKNLQNEIKNDSKSNLKNSYLLQEKKIKEKEEYLNNKEKELNLREQKIRKRELEINEEKLDILNKEEELDQKLKEINDKLILMKNKSYLMNIPKKENKNEEKNLSQEKDNSKELDEIESELEKEINIPNNGENKFKTIENTINLDLSNKFRKLNSIEFSNHKSPRANRSPVNLKYKRANTIAPNANNFTENNINNTNTERLSMKFNINRAKTLTNNLISPGKNKNSKINQTQTKINKNLPSLGLERIDKPNDINAVLQCLAHIPELAEGILELGYKEKYFKENTNVELSRTFASIVNNIYFPMKYNNNSRIYSPINFVDTFNQMCPLINQENPPTYFNIYEMLKFILDNFHNELNIKKMNISNEFDNLKEGNKIDLSNEKEVLVQFLTKFTNNNNSIISKLFFGLTKSKYVCNLCGNTKYYFDYYSYLYFDLPKIKKYLAKDKSNGKIISFISLNDCFDYLRRDINLSSLFNDVNLFILEKFGINRKSGKAFCAQCQDETLCSLNNYLYSSNTILPIILERGDDDSYLVEDIKFPNELNLENYIEFKKSVKKYYLCGVVSNLGKNNTFGKFVAYCKMTHNGKWFKYYNEKINSCTLDDIYNEGVPYLLIYHKI